MARKSSESKLVVAVTSLPTRLSPPSDFPLAESEVWKSVVATKPIDWFQADSAPLLSEYCRAVVMADRLAMMIEAAMTAPDEDGPSLKDLLKLRDMESRRVATLAVKMRLTQQSRYTPMASATADRKAGGIRPWEIKA